MKKIINIVACLCMIENAGYTQPIATDNQDVHVFPSNVSQSEVHISINKTNPDNLLVSSNLTGQNATNTQGHYFSNDGGITWNGADNMPLGTPSAGDPVTSFDASGNGFLTGMIPTGGIDGYFVQMTPDGGSTWGSSVRGSGPAGGFDKEMAINVDDMQTSPFANFYFCAWTDFGSSTRDVLTNRSTDFCQTFNTQHNLANFGQGTNVQTGPNGEAYIAWTDYNGGGSFTLPGKNIGFAVSTNGGVSYASNTAAFAINGIRTSNTGQLNFNGTRVNDFPAMAVDKSCNQHRGRIYIAVAEFDFPGSTQSVIKVRHSDDDGNTWSPPVNVNIPHGQQNWMPWVAVDDLTGLVNVVYYSMDNAGSTQRNTYVAYSTDGGNNWNNIRVSDVPHTPSHIDPGFTGDGYCGDYIGITSYGGKSYAAWYDNRNGTWQVYVSRVDYNISNTVSSPTNLAINSPSTITGNITYQACGDIKAADINSIDIASGSNVVFRSTKSITLHPGYFLTNNVKSFLAEIDPGIICCSTPGATARKGNNTPFERNYGVYNDKFSEKDIYAYPIPTKEFLTVGCYNSTDADYITIVDVNGRILKKVKTNIFNGDQLRNTIDVSELAPGNYLFSIDFPDGIYTGKFIKL